MSEYTDMYLQMLVNSVDRVADALAVIAEHEDRLAAVQALLDDPAHTAFVGVAALRRAVAGGQ